MKRVLLISILAGSLMLLAGCSNCPTQCVGANCPYPTTTKCVGAGCPTVYVPATYVAR